jgi:hypothetical protein
MSHSLNSSPGSSTHPLFSAAGTSPDPQPHPHPNAEGVLNTAAKHVFPDSPAPPKEEDKDVTHEANRPRMKADDEVDQSRPLLRGTPLDEIQTPMFERSAPDYGRGNLGRKDTSNTIRGISTIHEPEDASEGEDDDNDITQEEAEEMAFTKGGRPGLEAMRKFGSVSPVPSSAGNDGHQ